MVQPVRLEKLSYQTPQLHADFTVIAPYYKNPPFFAIPSNFFQLKSPMSSNAESLNVFLPDVSLQNTPLLNIPPLNTPVLKALAALTLVKAKYIREDLQRITNLYIDSFLQAQTNCLKPKSYQNGPPEGQLKDKFPELYFGKLHIDCYHFCQ